ncbi:MAG TPA: FtsX-like permease family protein [Solirubrobacteraceae bacterium]|jgi:putative ABC transport system permease protein
MNLVAWRLPRPPASRGADAMGLTNLLHLYRVRIRARLVQELFAIVGIAAGVGLLFASQVASQSLHSSVSELSHGITGRAGLQLLARGSQGMPASLLARTRTLPGVSAAAPVLEADGQASGPRGSRSVQLVGVDGSLKGLGGALVAHTELEPFAGIGAVLLPAQLAGEVGVTHFGREVTLRFYGRLMRAPLYEQLHARQVGGLAQSPIVVTSLPFAQEVTGLAGRLSRILVVPARGAVTRVRSELERLGGGRLNVESTDYDERLFGKAAAATNQSTQLFALISALVGFLFAFNAVLLTVAQRRRLVGELRREGYPARDVILVLLLDALVLGVLACALGLVLGEELSLHLFDESPGYLGSAFALGGQRVVGWQSIAIAVGGGLLASMLAVLIPMRAILAGGARLEETATASSGSSTSDLRLAFGGVACLLGALAILIWAPSLAILGMLALIAALLALVPSALRLVLQLLRAIARTITGAVAHLAAMELGAARTRAIGVAATGAAAVFGAVAIQGAHADLLAGLQRAAREENAYTDLWVSPPGQYNLLRTAPFQPAQQRSLAALAGVRAVRLYRGGLLDWGSRRLWVIAPAAQASPLLPPSQIEGSAARASTLVRGFGWVVISQALADERHIHLGERIELPSPVPTSVRVAALSTNIGWAPGAMIMSAEQFARAWGSDSISAYNVLLQPGASVASATSSIRRELGPGSGLSVQSAGAHEAEQNRLSRQGLERLSEIATLILSVAVLAMAAAVSSMLWQRRARLAKLKLEGFSAGTLWRTVLLESILLAGSGAAAGGVFGLLGQQLLDQALGHVINFPVERSLVLLPALISVAVVTAAAAAILAAAGFSAVRVPASAAMEE